MQYFSILHNFISVKYLVYFSQDWCVICLVCGKTFFSTEDIWKMFNLLVERCLETSRMMRFHLSF